MRFSKLLWTLSVSSSLVPATAAAVASNADVILGTRALNEPSERSIEARNILTDLLHVLAEVGDVVTCVACDAIFTALKTITFLDDDLLLEALNILCGAAGLFADSQIGDICSGAVALEGPIVAHMLRSMTVGGTGMHLLCNTIYGLCPPPDLQWTVPLSTPPALSRSTRPKPSGKKPIQIVQYTDLHVDPEYTTGASVNCSNPILCCRSYSEDDSPGHSSSPAGPYGEHKCDPPPRLQDSMFRAIKAVAPDAAFSIFTGDIIEHAIWNTSKETNEARSKFNISYDNQSSYFDLVYGVVGNHEASPVNLFPAGQPPAEFDTSWVFQTIAAHWSKWLGGSVQTQQVLETGSYSTKYPQGNLRIISLDTNYYYMANFWMFGDPIAQDPNGEFVWLAQELDKAEKARENVYIIGHMPMGDGDAFRHSSGYFNQIVRRYEGTIAAMFWGHTHVDHFEITYSDYAHRSPATAATMGYICPALTPLEGMPAFRVYDIDPDTFAVLDHTTYIANMASESFQAEPVWSKYYSAKEAYGTVLEPPVTDPKAELTPAFWHNVTEAMKTNQTLFSEYYARKSRGWDVQECSGTCASNEICQLQAGDSAENCVPADIFMVDQHQAGQGTHCGTSIVMMVLKSLSDGSVRNRVSKAMK